MRSKMFALGEPSRGFYGAVVDVIWFVLEVMLRVAFSVGIAYGGYALGRAYPEGIDGLKRLLRDRNDSPPPPLLEQPAPEINIDKTKKKKKKKKRKIVAGGSGSVDVSVAGGGGGGVVGEERDGDEEEEEEEEDDEGEEWEDEDDEENEEGRRREWERRRRRQEEIATRVQIVFEKEKEKMQQLLAREREKARVNLEREKQKERRRVEEEKEMEIQQLRRELERERQKHREKFQLSLENEAAKDKERMKKAMEVEDGERDRKRREEEGKSKRHEEEYVRWRMEHVKLRDEKERLVEELRKERDKVRDEELRQRRRDEVRERQWREQDARKEMEREARERDMAAKMKKFEMEKQKMKEDLDKVLRDLYQEREKARNREREESQRELARRRSNIQTSKEVIPMDVNNKTRLSHHNTKFDESTFTKWVRMRLGQEDKTVYWYWTGTLCSYPELETLARIEEYHALRMLSESPIVVNELSRNVTIFRDRETNEVLTEYNNESVASRWHPCDHTVYTLDGPRLIAKVTMGFGEYMRTRINIVQSVFNLHSTAKVAFSYYVKGSRYEYTNYDYIMDEAAGEEPGSRFCAMVRLGTFRPFADKAVANLIGWRIDDYDKLPPTIKESLSTQNTLWKEAPKNLEEIRRLQKVTFSRSLSTSRTSSSSS